MTKIRGAVEKITYQNPENGYSVLRVAVKGYNELSSRIIMNAHRINAGEFTNLSNGRNTDFFYIEEEKPELAAKKSWSL